MPAVLDASSGGTHDSARDSLQPSQNYGELQSHDVLPICPVGDAGRSADKRRYCREAAGIQRAELGETNLKANEATFDEKTDLKGPVSLAAVATKPQGENKKSRLVVYGNSAFASNGAYGLQGNGNLFLNTVSWLAQDENFISIRPKSPDDRRITMTEAQGRFVNYVLVLLLPVGIIGAGIRVWVRRRK